MKKITLFISYILLGHANFVLAQPVKVPPKPCLYANKLYPSGARIRIGNDSYVCINGQWILTR